jgi:hypothetical protein
MESAVSMGHSAGTKVFVLLFFQKNKSLLFLKKKQQKDVYSRASPSSEGQAVQKIQPKARLKKP